MSLFLHLFPGTLNTEPFLSLLPTFLPAFSISTQSSFGNKASLHHCNCILNQVTSDYSHHSNITSTQRAPWQKLTTVPFIWAVTAVCLPIAPELTWHTFMVGTFNLTLFTKCCKDKTRFTLEKQCEVWSSHWDWKKWEGWKYAQIRFMEQGSETDLQQNSGWVSLRQKVVAATQLQRASQLTGKEGWKCQDLWLLGIICGLVIWNLSKSLMTFQWKYCLPRFIGDCSKSVYFFMFFKRIFYCGAYVFPFIHSNSIFTFGSAFAI